MNVRWPRLFLLIFWLLSYGIGGLALPSVVAQMIHPSNQDTIPRKAEGGIMLKTASKKIPLSAPLLKTNVTMSISGLIARTSVSQQFSNPHDEWAEGVYVFPLPNHAAVDHLRMKIGERIIEGQIQERAQAKHTYAKAKAQGQQASLVEQERPNIFTASVANIAPQALITIDIEYQELVRYEQGRFIVRFPMVVGPRYIPGQAQAMQETTSSPPNLGWAVKTDQVPDTSRITPPMQPPSHGPLNAIDLRIDLAPGMGLHTIESPTHAISITKQEHDRYQITLREHSTVADRDFVLTWTPHSNDRPQATVFTERYKGEQYVFLQLMPPVSPAPTQQVIPREVIFVIDTSGSMAGTSLTQAKEALTIALSRLTPQDSFNLIQFNSSTHQLYVSSQPASHVNILKANQYIQNLQADGGTEMRPAFIQALAQTPEQNDSGHLRQILFITDGLIGNEEALFKIIQQDIGHTRLFTIGIGSAPNGHFMRKAALFGKGTFTHIDSIMEVQDAMNRIFHKLEHPALTDITINTSRATRIALTPNPLPDLYAGEPLTLAFRTSSLPQTITLTGNRAGIPWESTHSLVATLPRQGITTYWARQHIAQLMDQQTQQTNKSILRQSVIDLALKHHLVSRYTSLVAVDVTPVRPETEALHTHALKIHLPHGMEYESIMGWPQTATPATIYLVLGGLLIWINWIWSRHHLVPR